jgi:hypothetical protein
VRAVGEEGAADGCEGGHVGMRVVSGSGGLVCLLVLAGLGDLAGWSAGAGGVHCC